MGLSERPAVPARRDGPASIRGIPDHYNRNAETYMEVGLALGRAMADLLKGK